MEQETAATAIEKDPGEEQNAHDSSSTTGKKADEDQQILLAIEDTNWYRSTQALKYLQPVFMPIVMNEMKSLQLQSMNDFGRQLCAEATADDIRPVNGWLAQFKHLCPGTLVACQNLLNIIKGHTSDSVNFYQMLKGTDPQQWLKSPFEFVRLFLKDWMRCDIHDFQECDITALCTIVKRCKPLMQIFDERKIDELRNMRNRTMHPATMSISQEEMENNIDVILDFLEHIKSLKSTDEVTEAIESIKQLRTGDARLLHSMVVKLIQGWLPGARIAYEHNSDKAKNQLQDIIYMETILATLSSGQEITESARLELGAKITFSKKANEDKRELEKQNEKLIKRLKEEKRELEKQNEELSKRLNKEKRELEKQNEELRKRLETKERRSFGEVCPTKEMSTQRSPGDEHETVREELSKPWSTYGNLRKILSLPVMSCDERGTVKEKLSKQGSSYGNLRKTVSLPEMLGVKHKRVKEELSKQRFRYGNLKKIVSLQKMLGGEQKGVKKMKKMNVRTSSVPYRLLGVLRRLFLLCMVCLLCLLYLFYCVGLGIGCWNQRSLYALDIPLHHLCPSFPMPRPTLPPKKKLSYHGSSYDSLIMKIEELSKQGSSYGNLKKTVSLPEMLGDEHETVKEELSKPKPPSDSPRKTLLTRKG